MKIFNSKKGFTLIELLVAMSLFVIFTAIASGGFIRALRTQRAIVALMAVNDNTSLVLEQISREMRTGYNFCTNTQIITGINNPGVLDCRDLADNELMFFDINNQIVFYKWEEDEGAVYRGTGNALLNDSDYSQITGENVRVRAFNIQLMGNKKGDGYPPRITISISVSPRSNISYLENIYTNVQTTVSSRSLDT